MSTTKASSRFIPTLTEVVQSVSDVPTHNTHDLVDELMRTILPQIEAQLRASLQSSVDAQVHEAVLRLQGQVQQTIEEVLANHGL